MEILEEVKSYKVNLEHLRCLIYGVENAELSVHCGKIYDVPPSCLEVRMNKETFEFIKAHDGVKLKRDNRSTEDTPTIFGVRIRIDDGLETGIAQLWRYEG